MPTVLISGANRGLGLEFVKQYLDKGWNVFATTRNLLNSDNLKTLYSLNSKNLDIFEVDISNEKDILKLKDDLESLPIDVIINNAGIIGPRREKIKYQQFGSMNYDEWDNLFKVNTMGAFKITEYLYQNILIGNQKKIIVISSTVGSNIEMKAPIFGYASSKAALTKTLIEGNSLKKKQKPAKTEAEKLAMEIYKKMKIDWL